VNELPLILLALVVQGFFSGSEIAIVGSDRLILSARAEAGDRAAARVLKLLEQPTRLVGACLIGTNLAMISGTTLAAILFGRLGAPEAVVVAVYAPVSIIFAELIPKSVYHQYANTLAPIVSRPIGAIAIALRPVLFVVEWVTTVLLRLLGINDVRPHAVRREDIQLLLDNAISTDIRAEEKEMIQRVFSFSDTSVEDAMIPLIEVVGVPDTATCDDAAAAMVEHGYSRMPVYRRRIDRVVGVVSHHDLLFATDGAAPITAAMKPVVFVPETKRVDELFLELRRKRQRLAVAVDEYGGAVGLISIEDILEEIVGDIEDEFDRRRPLVRRVAESAWVASGRVEAEPLRLHTGFEMPEGDYETLAGFLLAKLGRVPGVGERLTWGNHVFIVALANERAILEVNIQRTSRNPPGASP